MNNILTEEELLSVCELIAAHTGLSYEKDQWPVLTRKLGSIARAANLKTIPDLVNRFKTGAFDNDQLSVIANNLTITETYFWRDQNLFNTLTDFILPELCKKNRHTKSIKIWSAGCSSGEEPYSIAIALHRAIKNPESWNISIRATDINSNVIRKAKSGIYSQWSFRNTPPWLKKTYFLQSGERTFEIIPEIKNMVTFSCSSLTDNNFRSVIPEYGSLDLIFCRNVLMYFTAGWTERISDKFYEALRENGLLIVSSFELSLEIYDKFKREVFTDTILYRKSLERSTSAKKNTFVRPGFLTDNRDIINPLPSAVKPVLTAGNPEPVLYESPGISEIKQKKVSQDKEIFPVSAADKLNSIRSFADKGQLEEALTECNYYLRSNKLSPELYFLMANILQNMNKPGETIKALKQALYLDPDNVACNYMLGNLYLRNGNSKRARIALKNTLSLLNNYSEDFVLKEMEDLPVKAMREIITANLNSL